MSGIHDQNNHLGKGDGPDRVAGGQLFQFFMDPRLATQARRIDQTDLLTLKGPVDRDGIAGDPGFGSGQQTLFTDQAVDQGRLASIGTADNGNADWLFAVLVLIILFDQLIGNDAEGGIEISHALAMFGRDGDRLAKAQLEGFQRTGLARPALGLIGGKDHGLAGPAQDLSKDAVQRRCTLSGIHDEQGDITFFDRQFGLAPHARFQTFIGQIFKSSRIDQDQFKVADPALGEPAVAGHPRLVIDDGQLLSGQTIKQRGLAHVWATDDRDFKRHERAVS